MTTLGSVLAAGFLSARDRGPVASARPPAGLPAWSGRYAQKWTAATLATHGTICHLCRSGGADTADHVQPRSKGGPDSLANLRPAHHGCNSLRGDMPLSRLVRPPPRPPPPDPATLQELVTVTHLADDRALAMRTLMPRAYAERTTNPATMYTRLTASGRAEVDRLVEAFREVRHRAVDELLAGQATQ